MTDSSAMRERSARERLRLLKDRLFGLVMGIGGISVIIAILLIFFYLFYVVLPLFAGASMHAEGLRESPATSPPALLALDEYAEIGLSV
ncbi:MAG: phosphate ABC transporter permease, partial [Gammaproteobacteria bacterium]